MRRIGVLWTRPRTIRIPARLGGIPAGAAAIGLDRRPQHEHRQRWAAGQCRASFASYAAELVALAPDVILAQRRLGVRRNATSDSHHPDRVHGRPRSGRLPALSKAWRGRAATSPASCRSNTSIGTKWLELLKQIAPGLTRAAVLRDPAHATGIGQFARHPGRGAIAWDGGEPGRGARRRRDRACHHGLRARNRTAD